MRAVRLVVLVLHAAAHVCDVRARKALGHTTRIECALRLGDARLFALLPYRVTGIEVAAPRQTACGTPMAVACTVRASAQAGGHVVRIDLRRPDGTLAARYGQNLVARGGRANAAVHFALNDPPGRWTLVARDVASGAEATRAVELKAE